MDLVFDPDLLHSLDAYRGPTILILLGMLLFLKFYLD